MPALTVHFKGGAAAKKYCNAWWKGRDSDPRPRHYELRVTVPRRDSSRGILLSTDILLGSSPAQKQARRLTGLLFTELI